MISSLIARLVQTVSAALNRPVTPQLLRSLCLFLCGAAAACLAFVYLYGLLGNLALPIAGAVVLLAWLIRTAVRRQFRLRSLLGWVTLAALSVASLQLPYDQSGEFRTAQLSVGVFDSLTARPLPDMEVSLWLENDVHDRGRTAGDGVADLSCKLLVYCYRSLLDSWAEASFKNWRLTIRGDSFVEHHSLSELLGSRRRVTYRTARHGFTLRLLVDQQR